MTQDPSFLAGFLRASAGAFTFRDGNSHVDKMALWAALILWVVGAAGILLGYLSIDNTDKQLVWSMLTGVMAFFFGRVHRREQDLNNNGIPDDMER